VEALDAADVAFHAHGVSLQGALDRCLGQMLWTVAVATVTAAVSLPAPSDPDAKAQTRVLPNCEINLSVLEMSIILRYQVGMGWLPPVVSGRKRSS